MTENERATLRHSLVCTALTALITANGQDYFKDKAMAEGAIAIADETMKQLYGDEK